MGYAPSQLRQRWDKEGRVMMMDRKELLRLRERLETERRRILADQTLAESGRLPAQLIHELADIEGAVRAVAAEIARHTPRVGYGGET